MKTTAISFSLTLCLTLTGAACSTEPGDAEEVTARLYGSPIGDQLGPGGFLYSRQSLKNNGYELVMQHDCNLVLYDFKDANNCDQASHTRVLWASNTSGRGATDSCFATMQADGNLVVYTGNWQAIWASGTDGAASGGTLKLQSDGNAVIYVGASAKWATGTNVNPSGDPRRCTLEKTYCCSGAVSASTKRVRSSNCYLLLNNTSCLDGYGTVSCNAYTYEILDQNGRLDCAN
jgi:hypothetical protein